VTSILLAGLLLLVSPVVSSQQAIAEQHQTTTAAHEGDGDQEADGSNPPATPPDGSPCAACEEVAKRIQPKPEQKLWQRGWAWGWAAVAAAILYSLVAWGQLCALNAQLRHQISLERPLLRVRGTDYPYFDFPGSGSVETARHILVRVPWVIENIGRSPAWLYRQTIRIVPTSDPPPDVPPPLTEDGPFAVLPISAGGTHSAPRSEIWTPEQMRSVNAGEACIMVYGTIRYRDGSQRDHRTRFCFTWRTYPNGTWGYDPIGPQAYIEYT
jgi:hypothetical protein